MTRRRQRSPSPEIDPRWLPRPQVPEADPAVPPVVRPGDEAFHRFHRFARDDDIADRDRLLSRATAQGYEALRPIHWTSLQSIHLDTRARTTCGPHWCRLFSISDTVCTELAIEFFSTIHLLTPLTDYERDDALTFRLGGVERRLSIHQFAVYMGLYTEEEIDTPAFRTELVDWPPEVKSYEFWTEIGTGAYTRPIPKSTRLRDPLHRLLHRAIVYSLASSSSSSGSVTLTDLFYLYSIITGRPCQIAVCLARYLFSVRKSSVQAIYGGGYVHRLARAMDILTPADFETLTLTPIAIPIDLAMMIRMQMVRRDGTRHILLGGNQQPWVAPREDDTDQQMGDIASGSGAQTEPQPDTQTEPAIELEQPAQQPSPRRHSPPHQRQPQTVYQRRHGLERDVSVIRTRVGRLEEIMRLEFAHADAHRQYTTRMLQYIAGGSVGTAPEPPEIPERLREFYLGASA